MGKFGLAPYLLCFVLLFDEYLNKKVQRKQLDIYLRFWNGNEVQSRYFTSIFMGHARAVDIEEDLKKSYRIPAKGKLSPAKHGYGGLMLIERYLGHRN